MNPIAAIVATLAVAGCIYGAGYRAGAMRYQQEARVASAAFTAKLAQAEKTAKEIEENYHETLAQAKAVAVANAAHLDGLRGQLAAAVKRRAASCKPDDQARFNRLADAAGDLAGWTLDCAVRVRELETQLKALQTWVRTR